MPVWGGSGYRQGGLLEEEEGESDIGSESKVLYDI